MQNWNIATDRAQRVNRKNDRKHCLVIRFIPQVMTIKMSKWLLFCIFCWCQQKISHSLDKIFMYIRKILFSSLRKCYGLLDSEQPLARYQPLKIQSFINFLLNQQFFDVSTPDVSQTVTPKPMNHTIFWKNSKRSFNCTF